MLKGKLIAFAFLFIFTFNISFIDIKSFYDQEESEYIGNILNNFKKGTWEIVEELKPGDYSSQIYRVCYTSEDGEPKYYVFKILLQGDTKTYKREKLACEKFKPYINDEKVIENICPPLECGELDDEFYYVIYKYADNTNNENLYGCINFLDNYEIEKRPLNEIANIWNDLLSQKLKAIESLNKNNILHLDAHSGNWQIAFYRQDNRKYKLKVQLIDFGSVIDVSNYPPDAKPMYYPNNKDFYPKDSIANHDLICFLDGLKDDANCFLYENNIVDKIQELVDYLKDGHFRKRKKYFKYSHSLTLKQRLNILNQLYDWLCLPTNLDIKDFSKSNQILKNDKTLEWLLSKIN